MESEKDGGKKNYRRAIGKIVVLFCLGFFGKIGSPLLR